MKSNAPYKLSQKKAHREWLDLLLSFLFLHADGADDEDEDSEHDGHRNGGNQDRDNIVAHCLDRAAVDALLRYSPVHIGMIFIFNIH